MSGTPPAYRCTGWYVGPPEIQPLCRHPACIRMLLAPHFFLVGAPPHGEPGEASQPLFRRNPPRPAAALLRTAGPPVTHRERSDVRVAQPGGAVRRAARGQDRGP